MIIVSHNILGISRNSTINKLIIVNIFSNQTEMIIYILEYSGTFANSSKSDLRDGYFFARDLTSLRKVGVVKILQFI